MKVKYITEKIRIKKVKMSLKHLKCIIVGILPSTYINNDVDGVQRHWQLMTDVILITVL